MAECAYLFHTAFPIGAFEYGQWQSVDLQPTMSRSLGFQNTVKMDENLADAAIRNPWTRGGALNTITGSSRFLLRKKSAVGDDPIVRLMTGVEAMRAMGWDVQHYHHATLPLDASQHDVLATLAGRAFFTRFVARIVDAIEIVVVDNLVNEEVHLAFETFRIQMFVDCVRRVVSCHQNT